MIYLALAFWLALPVSGWAGGVLENAKPGDTIVFAPGGYDKDHPPTLAPKDFQCFVRMQEALRLMIGNDRPFIKHKGVTHGNFLGGLYKPKGEPWRMHFYREYTDEKEATRDLEFIRLTMTDCVEGKP